MFRSLTNALSQIEYFFEYLLIGDLRPLLSKGLGYVYDLAQTTDKAHPVVSRRIGPPLPGYHTNITVVAGSMKRIIQILDINTTREPLENIDNMVGSKIFFSDASKEAVTEHKNFKKNIVIRNLNAVHKVTLEKTNQLLAEWEKAGSQDIRLIMSKICLGTIGKTMLGLKSVPDETHEVLTASMTSAIQNAFAAPLFSRQIKKEYVENKAKLHQLQVKLMEENKESIKENQNYISDLINKKESAEEKSFDELLSDPEILGKGPSTLLAGENIASLLMFVLAKLTEHPEIINKLREEIDSIDVTRENYNKDNPLPYLTQVFKEGLRYFSLTALLTRYNPEEQNIENKTIPNGYVFVPIKHLHESEEYWQDPKKFNPDRFAVKNEKTNNSAYKPDNSYMPFSAGARLCPGQKAAKEMFEVVMILLLQQYDLEALPNQQINMSSSAGGTKMQSPFMMQIKPRLRPQLRMRA